MAVVSGVADSVFDVSIIRLRAAVALIGRFPALAGVDLEVGEGEVVLVQGPNGAGKSTLLRLCAGLLRLESGQGTVLGHDLATERPVIRRSVGLLGHDTALYDDLTVRENLDFWARASRVDPAAVAPAMARLGVADRLHDVSVGLLSAGQPLLPNELRIASAHRGEVGEIIQEKTRLIHATVAIEEEEVLIASLLPQQIPDFRATDIFGQFLVEDTWKLGQLTIFDLPLIRGGIIQQADFPVEC